MNRTKIDIIQNHPCLGGDHGKCGRMHLPVAPRCNIQCRYCSRKFDCANESRPGVTSRILTPDEAAVKVRKVMADERLGGIIKVVGIAGPGDPLANKETYETIDRVKMEFPDLLLCLSTNGLLLPEKIDELNALGVHSITVTVNALDPVIGAQIYDFILYQGRKYSGPEAAVILGESQLSGIQRAVEYGMVVKVNTIIVPGINEQEAPKVAKKVKKLGAHVMNVMPMIPQARFSHLEKPDCLTMYKVRSKCAPFMFLMTHCSQCRADAVGLIGDDRKSEAESPVQKAQQA